MNLLVFLFLPTCIFASLDTTWWKNTILYQIYIWSFKDSNGDGIGDLNGITQKLDHFVDLGIDTIYVTPFFKSPMFDKGYDISNYTEIDPLFGTMKDFERLIDGVKKRGLKFIADLVINHSSDEHPWFNKSVERVYPYTDFYVWANSKGNDPLGIPIPPNNWMSAFGGCAWQWNEKRGQFYLHQFTYRQPDLNLRNKHLRKKIKSILKFWLDRGVAGFRLDVPQFYMEDELLRDEPLKDPKKKHATKNSDLKHIYTRNLPETYKFLHELKEFLQRYSEKNGAYERILIAEIYDNLSTTLSYYGAGNYKITDFPFNFHFARMQKVIPAQNYDDLINNWLLNMSNGTVPNWMAENHDVDRISARLGEEYMDIIIITMMTLPGIAGIYYGQEIGMQAYTVRADQMQDCGTEFGSRDGERLPMQWDSSLNSGFSSSFKTWLPVHPNYWVVNVEKQKNTKYSRYNMFKILSILRKTETMKSGDFHSYVLSKWVYAYVRSDEKHQIYVVILNLGTETEMFDLHEAIPDLPSSLKIVTGSQNCGYKAGDRIRSAPRFPHIFLIRPASAVVLTNGKITT